MTFLSNKLFLCQLQFLMNKVRNEKIVPIFALKLSYICVKSVIPCGGKIKKSNLFISFSLFGVNKNLLSL